MPSVWIREWKTDTTEVAELIEESNLHHLELVFCISQFMLISILQLGLTHQDAVFIIYIISESL